MAASHHMPDDWLDARLRGVPLPEGMLARLREVSERTDDEIEDDLNDVPLPTGLLARLEQVQPSWRLRVNLLQYAWALSIAIAIGLTFISAMALFLLDGKEQSAPVFYFNEQGTEAPLPPDEAEHGLHAEPE